MLTSAAFTIEFLIAATILAFCIFMSAQQLRKSWGIPMVVVLATTGAWYFVDVIYNDYSDYTRMFRTDIISMAWYQVVVFLITFQFVTPSISHYMNDSLGSTDSQVYKYLQSDQISGERFQRMLSVLTKSLAIAWLVLMVIAAWRVNWNVFPLLFPYLSYKIDPWSRNRIGGGIDAILAFFGYLQTFLASAFVVIAALSKRPGTQRLAIVISIFSLPPYLVDRTRNTILATVVPGFLSFVFLRLRGGVVAKSTLMIVGFLVVNFWFSVIMARRNDEALARESFTASFSRAASVKHEGLNMFEELCWINRFIESGEYEVNWGQRYFAELVNPIPRSLWPGKPLIGIDYAIARGQGGAGSEFAGVFASISTGMIGQGIVNFGRLLGPLAAALLLAVWVALVARQDLLLERNPGRLLLYGLGLITTFNLGRDVTLLLLYPFIFGWIIIHYWEVRSLRAVRRG